MRALIREVFEPFYHNGNVHIPLVILFILINTLVLANALLHDPYQGYDAGDHIHYIKTLAEKKAIPTCADTAQCYVPPLPYMLPALILATGRINLWQAAKFAQLINIVLSLGVSYYLLKICDLIDPKNVPLKVIIAGHAGNFAGLLQDILIDTRGDLPGSLDCLYCIPGPRTLPRQRPDICPTWYCLGWLWVSPFSHGQWALLVIPAICLSAAYAAFNDHSKVRLAISTITVCVLAPILLGGWYYYIMFRRYGSLTAWDRPASALSLSVFPLEFYLGTGSGNLFTDPIRPSFSNQFPAIFYSDTWGDYSAYFLIYAIDTRNNTFINGKSLERVIRAGKPYPEWLETNRFTFNTYLGQVNLVSLLPSAILAAGSYPRSYTIIPFSQR